MTKKFCYKRWVKVASYIVLIISAVLAFVSAVLFIEIYDDGVYSESRDSFNNEMSLVLQENAAIEMLSMYDEEKNISSYDNENLNYGIVIRDYEDVDYIDFSNKSIYDYSSLSDEFDNAEYNIFDFYISDDALYMIEDDYKYCNDILSEAYLLLNGEKSYIYNNQRYEDVPYTIDGVYYAYDDEVIYVKANDTYFYYGNIEFNPYDYGEFNDEGVFSWYSDNEEHLLTNESDEVESEYIEEGYDGDTHVQVNVSEDTIHVGNRKIRISDLELISSDELYSIEGEVFNYQDNYFFDGDCVYVSEPVNTELKHYYVVTYLNSNLITYQEWSSNDEFAKADMITDWLYVNKSLPIVILIVSIILFIVSFVILCINSGHYNSSDDVSLNWLDRIPMDLFTVICCSLVVIVVSIFYEHNRYGFGFSIIALLEILFIGIILLVIIEAYLMSFISRVKNGKWWRNSLIYKLFHGVICPIGNEIIRSIPDLWKVWIVLALIAFVELFCILAIGIHDTETMMTVWFIEKIVLYPIVILFFIQLKKIKSGTKNLAEGEIDSKIDNNRMLPVLKEYSDLVNGISDGVKINLNERIKSERFKTELITNVSHDIKTPLTSIINYADLLNKEVLDNEKAAEYIEVILRQSNRLKKLLEDLIEASKASTGNLKVEFEECNAEVICSQIVGEFEEKLGLSGIKIVINKNNKDIILIADPEHLWRVIDNLINNIVKYAMPGTRAYIDYEENGNMASIIFKNISKSELNMTSDELMERFTRGDGSRNTEGSGLGLSIAKSLTELMNGTFDIIIDGDLFKVKVELPLKVKN